MKIGFIGTGNMGSALISAAAKKNNYKIYVYDTNADKAASVAAANSATVANADSIAKECNFVILGVKPAVISTVMESIADEINDKTVIVSMAAGVSTKKIEDIAARHQKHPSVIRIMPNTPVIVGEGTILYSPGKNASENDIEIFKDIFEFAGDIFLIDEEKIDAGCAVSGCGPAFVYMFIEAIADEAVACGLTAEQAYRYACTTLRGAAKTVLETKKPPKELRDAVCSPAGSTIEGVRALEAGEFYKTVRGAVKASFERTKELGK